MATHRNLSSVDLQTRKLTLIEWLSQLDDVSVIKEIEALQKKRRIAKYEKSLKPMTKAELIKRSKQANKEIAERKYISSEELEREIATW